MFVILFILIPFSNGYHFMDMAVSFYERSHVNFICLLMCDQSSIALARSASLQNMLVSKVDIDRLEDFSKFDSCLTQRLPIGVLIDKKCNAFERAMFYASENMMLDSKRKWLIVDTSINIETIEDLTNINAIDDNIIFINNTIEDTILKEINENTVKNTKYTKDIDFINTEYNSTEFINNTVNRNKKLCNNNIQNRNANLRNVNIESKNSELLNNNTIVINILNDDLKDIVSVFNNLNMSVNTDITFAKRTENVYDLYEIYNFGKKQGGSLLIKKFGKYDERGIEMDKSYTFYRRWDFNTIYLNMIAVMSPIPDVFDPQMILGRVRDTRVAQVTQCGAQMLHAIAEIHNFKFSYTIVDRWVGNFKRNSTYVSSKMEKRGQTEYNYRYRDLLIYTCVSGVSDRLTRAQLTLLMKSLQSRPSPQTVTNALYFRESDITPILRFNSEFVGKLDLVQTSISNIETRYYYRIPSQGPGKFENQFLTPLSTGTWWCVVGVCTICGLVLLIASMFEERPFSFPYAFFSVFALVCQQFFEDTDERGIKRTSSARKITILVTGMSCVLIYNYYTSSVVSWLLNGPPPSINSLWELIDSPLQPIFEDIGYTRSWLQLPDYYYNKRNAEAEEKLKQKMYKSMKKGSIFRTVDDGIELVKLGGYAFHTEVSGANERISRKFDQRELCDLDSLKSMEKTVLFAAVQQNSPYKEFFSWGLMRLNERGIISCIQSRISSHESKCEGSSPRALALGGAAPAFILLAGGYLLGTIIMLVERYVYFKGMLNAS